MKQVVPFAQEVLTTTAKYLDTFTNFSGDSELGVGLITTLERENSSESLQHESIDIRSIRV